MFANGDTSSLATGQNFWVDTNTSGARLGRADGVHAVRDDIHFYVPPLSKLHLPS